MNRLRVAGAYEIAAGLVGIAFMLRPMTIANGRGVTFNLYAAMLGAASILAGTFVLLGGPWARRFSIVFQLLQVPRLASSAFVFGLLVGVEGTLRFQGPLLSLYTNTGINLVALRPYATVPTIVGINVVALTVAVLLWSSPAPRALNARLTTVEPHRDTPSERLANER